MCCKSFWQKIVPFGLALTFGVVAAGFFINTEYQTAKQNFSSAKLTTTFSGQGTGNGSGTGAGISASSKIDSFQIISKPRADYTDAARQDQVQGVVNLRVSFLANGEIGGVTVVTGLPNGLTESAVEAAKNIKFRPAMRDGKPVSVVKLIQYAFTIY